MTFKLKVPYGPKYFHLKEEKGQLLSLVMLRKLAFKATLWVILNENMFLKKLLSRNIILLGIFGFQKASPKTLGYVVQRKFLEVCFPPIFICSINEKNL